MCKFKNFIAYKTKQAYLVPWQTEDIHFSFVSLGSHSSFSTQCSVFSINWLGKVLFLMAWKFKSCSRKREKHFTFDWKG